MERHETYTGNQGKQPVEVYPGYPEQRLVIDISQDSDLEGIRIPDGPWRFNDGPLPTLLEQEALQKNGYSLDADGRPLHPWGAQLLSEQGVVIGKGTYWNWGPNYTADPIVITTEIRPRVLLIQRTDTGALALPGGFIDPSDIDSQTAAQRELLEETGLDIKVNGRLIYDGPVNDPRTTLNAWPETAAYLFEIEAVADVAGRDDAASADWYYVDELPSNLYGSHRDLIEQALLARDIPLRPSEVLSLDASERSTTMIDAGHMAYKHYVARHNKTALFVKEHDPSQFNDPDREMHSRAYLEKEHHLYTCLSKSGFSSIPENIELVDSTALAMEYLSPDEGWYWRAPRESIDQYLTDSLQAFRHLQDNLPSTTEQYHDMVAPSYRTFWQEGWDEIDNQAEQRIVDKIRELSVGWREENVQKASLLSENLVDIKKYVSTLDRSPQLFLAHNDARQSNIAWHPEKGVRLVDWSWADAAPQNADATMLLIDLAKSGHDVSRYMDNFNHDFAVTLIGFWLAHSLWQTRDGSTTVREHQVASAVTAYDLIFRNKLQPL
jgi:8-oxo-dGTP pyrophosphatase MutT (NUDIX family)